MELIRISAVWCSSCLIMKSRVNEIASELDIEIKDIDFDLDYEEVSKYEVGDVLPVLIYNNKRMQGEHTKEEIRKFLSD